MTAFGNLVKTATVMQPLFMGILVSALIGIALTLPISSAAICIMLSLDGSGRRCRHRRLLRADGRICRFKLL